MLPGLELMGCTDLAVPTEVMRHVVRVESSFNPYAIGVVGGRLARQPDSLPEAVSTAKMLAQAGYNFSLGLAQVNRHNLEAQGLDSYERAFDACANLQAGARILADCHQRAGQDWGKALSCYYSGNFVTGYRHGYVQKVFASWSQAADGVPVEVRRTAARAPSGARGAAARPGGRLPAGGAQRTRTPWSIAACRRRRRARTNPLSTPAGPRPIQSPWRRSAERSTPIRRSSSSRWDRRRPRRRHRAARRRTPPSCSSSSVRQAMHGIAAMSRQPHRSPP